MFFHRPASALWLAILVSALQAGAVHAQLVPNAKPSIGVDRVGLDAPGDIYPGTTWERRAVPPSADAERFARAAENAFSADASAFETRALLILFRGGVVYERYAKGFGERSLFPASAMSSILVNAGIGILVGDGKVSLDGSAPMHVWQSQGDKRAAITVRQLLTMTAGLDWRGAGSDMSAGVDEMKMRFGSGRKDQAGYAAAKRLRYVPGKHFQISGGPSQILSRIISEAISSASVAPSARREAVRSFLDRRLLSPLGIESAVIEFDRTGTFLGAGGLYMTAQDYARLGYLYLRGGEWNDHQILPLAWTSFTAMSGDGENSSAYGAQFWLGPRMAEKPSPSQPPLDAPSRAIEARDFAGQSILIVPERSLVIVRLGHRNNSCIEDCRANPAPLRDIVLSFPLPSSASSGPHD